jgi:hypothetical protein
LRVRPQGPIELLELPDPGNRRQTVLVLQRGIDQSDDREYSKDEHTGDDCDGKIEKQLTGSGREPSATRELESAMM